jgi:hypothetical protein
MSDTFYNRTLKRLSQRSREQKFALFHSVFRPRPEDRVLDVGVSGWFFARYTFEDFYPYPQRITAGTIQFNELASARRAYSLPSYVMLDGCQLPFADKTFEMVFSNAVIEHIMGKGKQAEFASEIMRVGKSWFVTTPNYWFPFEPHYQLPFIQFLPRPAQRVYNRLLGTAIPKGQVQDLALLSARELQRLFPTSLIARMRLTLWPETLVAYYIDRGRSTRPGEDSLS